MNNFKKNLFETNFKWFTEEFENPQDYQQFLHSILSKKDEQKDKCVETHYICQVCKSNLIYINVKQVRSGDEGQTTFCECSQCGTKWTSN